jgi:nickel-dependent lactate racemase
MVKKARRRSMPPYSVMSGKKEVYFNLPPGWKIIQNVKKTGKRRSFAVETLVKRSLKNPIGSQRQEDKLSASSRVAIMLDDPTRPTPKKEILLRLLEMIDQKKVPKKNITIIVAIGTHHKVSERALKEVLGKIHKDYSIVNHDCYAKDLIPVGRLSSGAEVKINPLAVHADVRIGVGSILPHNMNGFSGGGKIIMPGISDFNSIREHHLVNMMKPGSAAGNLEGNPFFEDIFNVAKMAKLDYIINAIYNLKGEMVEIVSGDFVEAFKVGVEIGRKSYGVPCGGISEVTITTAFPYDEGPHIIKPLGPAVRMTQQGGSIILVADLKEKVPAGLLRAFSHVRSRGKGSPETFVIEQLKARRPIIDNAPMDFNMGLASAFLYMSRVNVTIVSKSISMSEAEELGFNLTPSIEEAIEAEREKTPFATVNILPFGGMILPQFEGNFSRGGGLSMFNESRS